MPLDDFLGTGWGFPPTFSPGGAEVATVSDAEDIAESLRILLATRPGERVMRPRYGCDLDGQLFEEVDQGFVNSLTSTIEESIVYDEPRIELENVEATQDDDNPGLILISIEYTIRHTNARYNMVYPFYLDEASAPP